MNNSAKKQKVSTRPQREKRVVGPGHQTNDDDSTHDGRTKCHPSGPHQVRRTTSTLSARIMLLPVLVAHFLGHCKRVSVFAHHRRLSSKLGKPDLLRRKGEEPSPEHSPLDAACFGFLAGYVNGNTKVRFDTFGGMMTGNTINFAIRLQTGQFAFAAATASLLFSFVLGRHARLERPASADSSSGHTWLFKVCTHTAAGPISHSTCVFPPAVAQVAS